MTGGVSLAIQFIIVLVVIMALFAFALNIGAPTLNVHGDVQARLIAQSTAFSIGALASVDGGVIQRDLEIPWNVEIYKRDNIDCTQFDQDDCGYFVKVSHEKYEGEAKIIGTHDIELRKIEDRTSFTIQKSPGGITLN